MPKKVPQGGHLAVGYWGRNPNCRIVQEQVPDKLKALLQDKLIAMGRPCELWLPVNEDTAGVVHCTCDKETRPAGDFRCMTCYGMRFAPGYQRFLHETLFWCSAEYASFTLVNVSRDTEIKPNRLRLSSAALTGTVTTQDKAYANPRGEDWTFEVAAFRKTSTDVILAEFSTDGGTTWTDLTLINGANKPTGSGNIRLRITLTRSALTTDSPDFEIARVRRRMPERMTKQSQIRHGDDALLAGQILVLRTWVVEQAMRQLGLARQVNYSGDKSWTAPLDFYDTEIEADTPSAKINDRDAGPHPFYERAYGIGTGERFPLFQISWNEELLTFTHQHFFDRKAQPGELYHLVY